MPIDHLLEPLIIYHLAFKIHAYLTFGFEISVGYIDSNKFDLQWVVNACE